MTGRQRRQSQACHDIREGHRDRTGTQSSGEPTSQTFFEPDRQVGSKGHVWKSTETKEKEQYEHTRKRVQHLAPQQFHNRSTSDDEPCNIFPTTFQEWKIHRRGMLKMALEEMERNQKLMTAKMTCRNADARKAVTSVFGVSGKIFDDGLSPVLALPTIWAAEYHPPQYVEPRWPKINEMKWHADEEGNKQAKKGCGRPLPVPRYHVEGTEFCRQPTKLAFPFDATGPVYVGGQVEIVEGNIDKDGDSNFLEIDHGVLGESLLHEIGR